MKKTSITTEKFINQSIGEWKSIRSSHSLAFQEFENTNSNILIKQININNQVVQKLLDKFQFDEEPLLAIEIAWHAISDWEERESQEDKTVLVFLPKEEFSGLILRNKGYAESIQSYSEYFFEDKNKLTLKTIYSGSTSEEKIWFLSENIRARFSVIKEKINKSILQTSYSTEIRKIPTLKD